MEHEVIEPLTSFFPEKDNSRGLLAQLLHLSHGEAESQKGEMTCSDPSHRLRMPDLSRCPELRSFSAGSYFLLENQVWNLVPVSRPRYEWSQPFSWVFSRIWLRNFTFLFFMKLHWQDKWRSCLKHEKECFQCLEAQKGRFKRSFV